MNLNCYIHTDKPAVTTCPECGMGLCRDCVDNAVYYQGNYPLCHDCSLKQAMADLADAKSKKVWSLIKFIFGGSFLLLGICIYSSTGDIMNAWIYAGIAGIPAAFRSTRDSKREQVRKGVRDALTTDVVDTSFNFFGDILARILAILLLAPLSLPSRICLSLSEASAKSSMPKKFIIICQQRWTSPQMMKFHNNSNNR